MDLEVLNKKEISRDELERLYKELGPSNIIDLYNFACLITSGFSHKKAYDLLKRFTHVWLNDKNEYTPSKLSNMLFKAYDDLDGKINDLSTKEILDIIYKYGI